MRAFGQPHKGCKLAAYICVAFISFTQTGLHSLYVCVLAVVSKVGLSETLLAISNLKDCDWMSFSGLACIAGLLVWDGCVYSPAM